jgi:plasmid stabilization system protein ParE
MAHAIWSPEASLDLEEIALYIGIHDGRPTTADRIVRDVLELANLIATQPGMGASRPEFGSNCRAFSFENRWMILYRKAPDGIDVLRFVDATRDFDRLF